jgi:hypothetical protein
MPYDEANWKRRTLAHYLALAQIDVPGAVATALMLAAAAEANSSGGLDGLQKKLREEIEKRMPGQLPKEKPSELRTAATHQDRNPAGRHARNRR